MAKNNYIEENHSDKDRKTLISFHNISYVITEPSCCLPLKKFETKKEILKNVSGIMNPGLNAIMGPTGSGKTSLLDVLAKRKDPTWLTGNVLMNSQKLPQTYKYLSGYVVQRDILKASMTVRETFWFSANMRLQPKVSDKEKKNKIEKLIEQLGLEKCANTRIGNDIRRGISGGERKRTSIGLELLTDPRVLYVDEPTTGLDASTANTVMLLLKKFSSQGQTIVVSIHQPRYSIFRLFDTLTLLSLGQCIYHGRSEDALPYFNKLGYMCENHNNPADFFLDVVDCEVGSLDEHYKKIDFDDDTKHERHIKITNNLHQNFLQSEQHKSLQTQLQSVENESASKEKSLTESHCEFSTPFIWQLKHLLKRDITNIIRSPQGLVGQIITNFWLAILCGIVYFQLDKSPDAGSQDRFGLFFFITTNLLFTSITVITIFIQDRALFIHEYVSGYHRIASYFISKILAEVMPMRTLCPLIFAFITYWMSGLKNDAAAFGFFILVTCALGYASVALALFFSVSFSNITTANIALSAAYVFSYIFSGLLVNIANLMPWISWIQYLSMARYGMVGITVNEFMGQVFTNCYEPNEIPNIANLATFNYTTTIKNNQTCIDVEGEEFLKGNLAISSSTGDINSWTLWQNVVALICMSCSLFVLTYIQLVRLKKYS